MAHQAEPFREVTMTRISISEARRRLSQFVRQLQEDRGGVVLITMRGEVVAELRAAPRAVISEPEPGAAARALLELVHKLPKHRGRRRNISGHVKKHLYGRKA
jgi:antitoxin (DNA-binding transcriptional repressor) of toxin-antitoxin stability system